MVWLGWKWAKWLGKWAMLKPYWHFRVKEKLIYTTENHQFWNILIMEKNYYYSFHRLIQELRKCLSPKNGNNFEFSSLYFLFPGLNISKLIIFICIHELLFTICSLSSIHEPHIPDTSDKQTRIHFWLLFLWFFF